jgi:8-oxo-dGTP diphosphatase
MTTIATLCYIVKGGKILLIQKKRGLGAGKWNGPGGKVDEGEILEDAAAREVFEEINVVPENPKKIGDIEFYFGQESDIDWHVHIFVAEDYDGIEKETNEAVPKWFSLQKIPYDEMWPDDRVWLPLVLQRKKFRGKFYFDKDAKNILKHDIEVLQ